MITPTKISRMGDRYYIEIPRDLKIVAEKIHGKPLKVKISLIDFEHELPVNIRSVVNSTHEIQVKRRAKKRTS